MTLTPNKDFATGVMDKIQAEQIKTYSRAWFVLQDSLFWVCWFLSALFGALALAATLFVMSLAQVDTYFVTHDSLWSYLREVMPYVWLLSFAVMCVIAHIGLRHTPKGYRYSATVLIILNLSITVLLAIMLFFAGMGEIIDARVGSHIPHYQPAMVKQEMRWYNPQDGLFVGRVQYIDRTAQSFQLESPQASSVDIDGRLLSEEDWNLLEMPYVQVRVIVIPRASEPYVACLVLPMVQPGLVALDHETRERLLTEPRSSECKGVRPYDHLDQLKTR